MRFPRGVMGAMGDVGVAGPGIWHSWLTSAAQHSHLSLQAPDVPRRRRRHNGLRLVQARHRHPRGEVRSPTHTSPRALAASPRAWSNKRRSSRGQELTRKQRIRPRKELVEDPPPPRPPGRGGSRPGAPVPRGPEAGEGAPGREHEGLPQRPVRPSPPYTSHLRAVLLVLRTAPHRPARGCG